VGEYIYGFDDNAGGGSLKCIEHKTGETKWSQEGLTCGGLMVADGKLVALADKGKLVIAEASPAGFKQLASARILDNKKCWTMPVLANSRIYARNNSPGDLVALDVSGK
jgi:outer membrane protein assembly factor BamB